jgi:hypothetical protein
VQKSEIVAESPSFGSFNFLSFLLRAISMSVSPSDEELYTCITQLRSQHPVTGILKLLSQLKLDQPTWTVSEKRFRKALQHVSVDNEGDAKEAPGELDDTKPSELDVTTGLDPTVDATVAPKVKVKMFKGGKGKGLVAREKLLEGEILWTEEPWIVTADRWGHVRGISDPVVTSINPS